MGNELRGDDAAGLIVARLLPSKGKRLFAVEGGTAPENFTGVIIREIPSHVVIVDSAWMNLEPGSVRMIATKSIDGASFSTHTLPAGVIISYLEKSIGCETITMGIQPGSTEFGAKMTPAVKKAATELAKAIRKAVC